MKLKSLRVSQKLWLSLCSLVVVFVAILGITGQGMLSLQQRADQAIEESTAKIKAISEWAGLSGRVATRFHAMLLNQGDELPKVFNPQNGADLKRISELQGDVAKMPLTQKERKQTERVAEVRAKLIAATEKVRQLSQSGSGSARETFANELMPAISAYQKMLDELLVLCHSERQELVDAIAQEKQKVMVRSVILVILTSIAALFVASLLVRSFTRPLKESVAAANRIASGDLTQDIDSARGDEFGDLLRTLGVMNNALRGLIHETHTQAEGLLEVSRQIVSENDEMSRRTEQQAASLEETAASMEQLTSAVQSNEESARQVTDIAEKTSQLASRGGKAMEDVQATMDLISTSSEKIVDIMSVIDSIAFQTNILAINAAVESARAGEQGRGFSVVAREVRTLAQRAGEAAKEVRGLVTDSAARVKDGNQSVSQAGRTIEQIVSQVSKVSEMMSEFADTGSEQSKGLAQINAAIAQLDDLTQKNAAMVESAVQSAVQVDSQANQLATSVKAFSL